MTAPLRIANASRFYGDRATATSFLRHLETSLGLALERGVKIVRNVSGLNPGGLAQFSLGLPKSY